MRLVFTKRKSLDKGRRTMQDTMERPGWAVMMGPATRKRRLYSNGKAPGWYIGRGMDEDGRRWPKGKGNDSSCGRKGFKGSTGEVERVWRGRDDGEKERRIEKGEAVALHRSTQDGPHVLLNPNRASRPVGPRGSSRGPACWRDTGSTAPALLNGEVLA